MAIRKWISKIPRDIQPTDPLKEDDNRRDGTSVPNKRQRPKTKSNFMLIKSLHHK